MMNESHILDILKGVIDPDIGINIVDLGLVEEAQVTPGGAYVGLIMTTPACPQTGYLMDECRRLLAENGIAADVAILDYPFWQPSRMSETAKRVMGWEG